MSPGLTRRSPGILSRMSSREKALLVLMIGIFGSMFAFIFGKSFLSSGGDLDSRLTQYENALQQLSSHQDDFIEMVRRSEEINGKLATNELQLRTFLEGECRETSIAVPSIYNDSVIPQRDPETGEARIVEYETVATINSVNPTNLSRLMHRIATSPELILLKAIDVRPSRRNDGSYQVRLTVSTYKLATGS